MRENLCIVCEGGGTKIAYAAGVLKCLLEEDILADHCVGVSAGSEVLIAYAARNKERLHVIGVDATARKECVGLSPLLKEHAVFGLAATIQYIDEVCPLDFDKLQASSTALDTGLYNIHTHEIEYFDKSYVREDNALIQAACALLMLCRPHQFEGNTYIDAGIKDMISIEKALEYDCRKYLVISTKEEGYVRKPTPKWQLKIVQASFRDSQIVDDYAHRKENYDHQWDVVHNLEKEGRAMVLRPHKDLGVTRYTRDYALLDAWFDLGYDETKERIGQIRDFLADDSQVLQEEKPVSASKNLELCTDCL